MVRFYRNKGTAKTSLQPKGSFAIKYPLQSTSNKPVKTIYKKRPTQTKAGMNKQAIFKLARQVKTLQNQRLGLVQTHTQWCELTGDNIPTNSRPIAFGLNNFYDQDVYKGLVTSGVATYANAGTLARQTYISDLNDEYEWNAHRNKQTVSLEAYKPIFTRMNILWTFNNDATASYTGKCRVTILKINPYHTSNKLNVGLPGTLGAYRYLTRTSAPHSNYFDKKYHKVLKDVWITVRPPANSNATLFTRNIKLDYRFDTSILKPNIDPTNGETFWTNTLTGEQIWVLLSTDAHAYINKVAIEKFDVWRDQHGTND